MMGMCMRCEKTVVYPKTVGATGPDGEPLPVVVRICYNCTRRGTVESLAAKDRGAGRAGTPPWRRS